jgi:hypothetical protein
MNYIVIKTNNINKSNGGEVVEFKYIEKNKLYLLSFPSLT